MSGSTAPVDRRQLLDAAVALPSHVVYRAFVGETVVLNLHSGKYHGLNPTGGRMLELLAREPTVRSAAGRLAAEYARPIDEIEGDLYAFCVDLMDRGLIEVSPNVRR